MKRFSRSVPPRGLRSDSAVKMVRSRPRSARAAEKLVGDQVRLADAERQGQYDFFPDAP
jgi:hypothetical protein